MDSGHLGSHFTKGSGIVSLMEDLGSALEESASGKSLAFLGGGNPAHILEIQSIFQREWERLGKDSLSLGRLLGEYAPPLGDTEFREIVASALGSYLGVTLTKDNIAITAGSQSAFFALINLWKGKVLLPIVPEYIGYADQSISRDSFLPILPKIIETGSHRFRYEMDWSSLETAVSSEKIAMALVSRPTNPTGNMISSTDWTRLSVICKKRGIPLVLDNAYGDPFPGIVFEGDRISWSPGQVFVYSLSKFGLPGVRTGIVVADPDICRAIGDTNSILQLAVGNLGTRLTKQIFQTKEVFSLSQNVIQPFYAKKRKFALEILDKVFSRFQTVDYKIHESHGAFFLWLWFPSLKDSMGGARVLYQKLKEKEIIVVPGDSFFLGVDPQWSHRNECIRIQFGCESEEFERGVRGLAEVLDHFSRFGNTAPMQGNNNA